MESDINMNSLDNENLKTYDIFEIISSGDIPTLKLLINKQDFLFWKIKDNEGITCLIKSTFLNFTEISILLIETAKNRLHKINEINFVESWINHKADNGFNALHYSSFRGNLKLVEKLIENGADITIKNNNGLNVMHMACQGDRPNVLVYFKEKHGLSLNSLDSVNSTPLHWCCYMGSENCLDYLVSWKTDLNAKDKDGFTPLHLAVMTGADLDIQDTKNRKPLDLAIIRNNMTIIDIFNQNMDFFACKFNFNERNRNNSGWGYITAFIFFILLIEAVTDIIILPFTNSIYRYEMSISLFITILFSFMILHYSDPGFKQNKINKSLLKLAIEGESMTNICPYCSIYKSSSSRHCYNCNKCVEDFDHHCIWISNCIGKKNYFLFILFLIIFAIKLVFTMTYAIESNLIMNDS